MKTQDMGYITHKLQIDTKRVEKLRKNIHLVGAVPPPRTHKLFVDSEEDVLNFDAVKHFDTQAELVDRVHNRLRNSQLDEITSSSTLISEMLGVCNTKKRRHSGSGDLTELNQRSKRVKKLERARDELAMQRHLSSSKGQRVKLESSVSASEKKKGGALQLQVYKWRRERCK
jgi:hypothetical protein